MEQYTFHRIYLYARLPRCLIFFSVVRFRYTRNIVKLHNSTRLKRGNFVVAVAYSRISSKKFAEMKKIDSCKIENFSRFDFEYLRTAFCAGKFLFACFDVSKISLFDEVVFFFQLFFFLSSSESL